MQTAGVMLRPLGPYEAIFARAQRGDFVMAFSFAGTVPAAVWESAVAAVVERHPMLRVRIEERNHTLDFEAAEEGNLRLWHVRREDVEPWRETAGRWLAGSMGAEGGELVRLVVLEGEGSCELLLGMHHALGDGKSALGLVEDLLRAVDGLELRSYTLPPDVDQLLEDKIALPNPAEQTSPMENWLTPFLPYEQPWAALETASLSVDQTSRLRSRARAESCTVTGALAAAMVNAWRKAAPQRRAEPVRLMMPVDVRSRVGLGTELMLAISTTNQVVRAEQSESFWDLARAMTSAAAAALRDDVLLSTAAGRANIIRAAWTKDQLDELSERYAAWDLLLSNLGAWQPAYQSKALRLTDVWGPAALYGFEGEQSLGAITFEGELRLSLSSRVALPGLLDAIQAELREVTP